MRKKQSLFTEIIEKNIEFVQIKVVILPKKYNYSFLYCLHEKKINVTIGLS